MTAVPSISIKGIVVGALVALVLSFAVGFGVLILAISQLNESSGEDSFASGIAAYFVAVIVPQIIAGYATAVIARRQKLINAILTGTFCASVAFLIDGITRGLVAAWQDASLEELAVFPLFTFVGGCLGLVIGWPSALTRFAAGPRRRIALTITAQTLIAISVGSVLMTFLDSAYVDPTGSWPAFAIFSFALLGCLKWFYRFRDAPWFAAAALFGLALQTSPVLFEPSDFANASLWQLVGACVGSAVLGYFARRRSLLALVIAVPSFSCGCFSIVPLFDIGIGQYADLVLHETLPFVLASLVGACIADLLRNIRRG
jgi:MFS family permease